MKKPQPRGILEERTLLPRTVHYLPTAYDDLGVRTLEHSNK